MKSAFAFLAALAPLAVRAHYTLPDLTVGGVKSGDWTYIRETANHYSNGPVTSVTDQAIRCYELDYSATPGQTQIATVSAGSTLTVSANGAIYHPGTIQVYMSAASDASSTSAGTGQTWFKIYEDAPTYTGGSTLNFPSTSMTGVTFTVPSQVPSGNYLIRVEQIALHVAGSFGGAQFYLSCAQVNVVNGGSGSPGPLVSFPGAYTGREPGILIDINNIPAGYSGYVPPGPSVWPANGSNGGGGGGSPSSSTKPTTTVSTTKPTTTSSSAPSSCTASMYSQCGGTGFSGCTTCATGSTCKSSSQYYSQCL